MAEVSPPSPPHQIHHLTNHPQDRSKIYKHADQDGQFRRKDSSFRNFISRKPGAEFPPEKDRYVLYINLGCPFVSPLFHSHIRLNCYCHCYYLHG
jgi:hypothetical protein